MIELVPTDHGYTLDNYESIAHLASEVRELRAEAAMLIPRLAGRTLWMVNSTAQGGGVAEMLPQMVSLLEELGLPTRWAVIGTDKTEYFSLTKRIYCKYNKSFLYEIEKQYLRHFVSEGFLPVSKNIENSRCSA